MNPPFLKPARQFAAAPHFALLAVQIMFGTFPVVGKIVLQSFPSLGIVAFRIGGACIAFFILQSIAGGIRLERRKDYWLMAIYALLGVILNQILSVTGLSLTTATNSALLAVMMPVFIAMISVVFGFDKLGWSKVAGILVAAGGVVYLIDPARANFSTMNLRGDLMIIANGFCYASYIAISKNAIARNGALRSLFWLFFFGALVCVPLGAASLASFDFSQVPANGWLALAFIVLFPTVGAYYLNAWALARLEPSVVAVYIYLQPLIGFSLAVVFLGEQFTLKAVIAGLLIFIGVFLVTRQRKIQEMATDIHASLR